MCRNERGLYPAVAGRKQNDDDDESKNLKNVLDARTKIPIVKTNFP